MNDEAENMTIDTNPYRDLSADITPDDFEPFCLDTLKACADEEGLANFDIKHDQKIEVYDGTYQIDVLAEFTALRSKIKVLVECKKLSRAVDRDKAMLLHGKLQSIGANKGILISTTGFQSGAVQYAKMHGLTLWQLCDRRIRHVMASGHQEITDNMKIELLAEQYLPKYFMMAWDCDMDYPCDRIYPTKEMYRNAIEKVRENYSG